MRRLTAYLLAALAVLACAPASPIKTDEAAPIWPDYAGVCVPENIAPLNFKVPGASRVAVSVNGGRVCVGRWAKFPLRRWKRLLEHNDSLSIEVCAKMSDGWKSFEPFSIYVSRDAIDPTLVYRRIDPGYELYAKMGIYQRDLASFRERSVYLNNDTNAGCVNCHSFAKGDPSRMQLHLRGSNGGSLIKAGGDAAMFNMKNDLTLGTVYPYWHPEGRYIAYSVNDIKQSFHNIPGKVLEVYDLASDVTVYDTENSKLLVYPVLQDSARFETFPAFSADGKTLYFCSAPATKDFGNVRYELCSIGFDSSTGTLGTQISTIWSAEGKSVSFPRPSYDGRYLMFTVSDFGNFSIWHPEAELYQMDLASGEVRPLSELNSPDTESYHSWSTNSKWAVFSSRRGDGRHTRLYISHIGPDGNWSKPFLLPQKNPDYDKELLQSYNIPEFCTGRVEVDRSLIHNKERQIIKAEIHN